MTRDELIEEMTPAKKMPSQERLQKLFDYDQLSGSLRWKHRPAEDFKTTPAFLMWNKQNCGAIVGWVNSAGYMELRIDNASFRAHRVIWVYFNGDDANFHKLQIDHIDHDRSNNRIENLRVVDRTQNMQNASMRSNNKSGHIGVHWHSIGKKWKAEIRLNGKAKHLGLFANIQDAIEARVAANVEFGFHPNHGEHPR